MIAYTQATIKTVVTGFMMDHECLKIKCEYACVSASKIKDHNKGTRTKNSNIVMALISGVGMVLCMKVKWQHQT